MLSQCNTGLLSLPFVFHVTKRLEIAEEKNEIKGEKSDDTTRLSDL